MDTDSRPAVSYTYSPDISLISREYASLHVSRDSSHPHLQYLIDRSTRERPRRDRLHDTEVFFLPTLFLELPDYFCVALTCSRDTVGLRAGDTYQQSFLPLRDSGEIWKCSDLRRRKDALSD
ncbi:hypothetical protein PoB_000197800 [Plakobranchus ocellatus]|uniref:Uncharacterized protein n=1 Tax=Plakobranchus ocellatus TaxID=259542 RepID=A0AAV3XZR9_9GAST|nr:hypothetical protein PoB_000197800 [Plakobranchus ocellatus]